MLRAFLSAAVVGVGGLAVAAPVPKTAPAPAPQSSASFLLGTAVLADAPGGGGSVLKFSYENQSVAAANAGGRGPVARPVNLTYQFSSVKVTTADGKELTGDDLTKALASAVPAVRSATAFDAEWRKLFADDVLFVELVRNVAAPGLGGAAGGAVVRPLPLVRPALPVVPPPVEEKKEEPKKEEPKRP